MQKYRIIKIIFFVLVILLGIFLFIYGGYDDSPGCQLLGVLVSASGVWGIIKNRNKNYEKK
jgi:hypothetical protein